MFKVATGLAVAGVFLDWPDVIAQLINIVAIATEQQNSSL